MDQKPRPSIGFSVPQTTTPAVTCQTRTTQIAPAIVAPHTSSYVLTSSNLRSVTNYTLVAGGAQVPVTQQYVVQSTSRTAPVPQYVSTGNMRHILSASSQPSNVTYMLPSGAHIVKMNNVLTTTMASDQRSGQQQFILASNSQKTNPNIITPLGSQTLKTTIAAVTDNSGISSGNVSRTLSVTTTTASILQRSGVNIPKINTAYYSQIKGNESPKISFRPKLNDQKPSTSYILTSNDWPRTKNVPISSLQKVNTNYMQIPLIQKPGTIVSTNALKSNVDVQQQKPQQQSVRSVILPSNYRTATVSQQQGADCKLVLNSINVGTPVLNSNDAKSTILSTPVSNIQQLNTNYMQIPIAQKPGNIINRTNSQSTIESNINNIRIGQQHQTIKSVILPPNYRTMMSSPQKGVDYKLILKPVNIQSQPNVIKNMPLPRYSSPRNPSVRNTSIRPTSSVRPNPLPPHASPMIRPPTSRIQNEIIANSKIIPISLSNRKNHLIISKRSVEICIDEMNNSVIAKDQTIICVTEQAIELLQAEVTYRLYYLLRECKKFQMEICSNVLTEESVRQVCANYFATFYGNKLWPLFCLKPNDEDSTDENRLWMRKHNNVNLIGWLKHPKFRNPSYIKKRHNKKPKKTKLPLHELMKVSEVIYESSQPIQINQESNTSQTKTRMYFPSMKNNEVPFDSILPKNNVDDNVNNLPIEPTLQPFIDHSETH